MRVEYGPSGLVGVLVPQANTTVEPEFAILFPQGVASIAARMVSPAATIADRLVAYFDRLDDWVTQFANAPLDVIAVACTGASYLVGRDREAALVAGIAERRGVRVVTSGMAVVAALRALSATHVAVVSPNPRALTEQSLAYWASFGITATRVVEVGASGPSSFHPIYAMAASDAGSALATLDDAPGVDAVVMLGTGMPTLRSIRDRPRAGGAPVLSCMLATAWLSMLALDREAPSAANLLAWIDQPEWAARL